MQNENKHSRSTDDNPDNQQNVQASTSVTTTPQSTTQFSRSNYGIKILTATIYFVIAPLFLVSAGASLVLLSSIIYASVRHEEGLGLLGLLVWFMVALVFASITGVPTFLFIKRLWRSDRHQQLASQTSTTATPIPTAPIKSPLIWRGLLIAVPLIVAAGLTYSYYYHQNKIDIAHQGHPAASDTPIGTAAQGTGDAASGFAIKVTAVTPNSPFTGDSPNPGLQYVEIDLSITNGTKQPRVVPGTFLYQTSANQLLAIAYKQYSGPLFANSNKSVQTLGKQQYTDATLVGPGQTSSYYLIYQVPNGDKGKLIWYEGIYDTSSTKLAVFDLY